MKLRLITSSGKIITLKPATIIRTPNNIILNFNNHKKLVLTKMPNKMYAIRGGYSSPDFRFLDGTLILLSPPNNSKFKGTKPNKVWYQNNPLT